MCPLCWAALVAQMVFVVTLGVLLVSVTDWKFSLPLSLVTLALTAGVYARLWFVPSPWMITAVCLIVVRNFLVLVVQPDHWVRAAARQAGAVARARAYPLVVWLRSRKSPGSTPRPFQARFAAGSAAVDRRLSPLWRSALGRVVTWCGS